MHLQTYRSGFVLMLTALLAFQTQAADNWFKIQVIDEETQRGVPLVELETVNHVHYVTDSNGLIALNEPALFGQRVFFLVRSHGYEFAADGFGYRGQALNVQPGGNAVIKLKRLNLAQRLYRITGADVYRDSVLLKHHWPVEQPLLNAQVLGSDSVVNTVFQNRIYWFWGDTNRPGYPLGNFHVPGAVSNLPSAGGLDPELGVNLTYFVDDNGFAKPVAKMPGEGPTWIDGLVTLQDEDGRERMFASYVKIKPPLTAYARGLVEWNVATQQFDHVTDFELNAPVLPGGHPLKHTEAGVEYIYFARPYPLVRVRATAESLSRLDEYEAYTCLAEGSRLEEPKLDRDAEGGLRYAWKRNTPPLDPQTQKRLIEAGQMTESEGWLALRDRDTGKPVLAHGGSVYWNEYRQRWVMVFLEIFGSASLLGEVWYAEADEPVGPWLYATKIATHDRYDFYNPKHHPMLDAEGGRVIYFEGTYTSTFSGNPIKTPRYDYNQVMYKLELDDPRLALPVAIYRSEQGHWGHRSQLQPHDRTQERIEFFALDRAAQDTVPIFATSNGQLALGPLDVSQEAKPSFYALPINAPNPPTGVQPLYEFRNPTTGKRCYATDANAPGADYQKQSEPLGLVWPYPLQLQ